MEDLQSPKMRFYKSHDGDRNLQLVNPTDLKAVRGIYIVRESKQNRSLMTSDLWRKVHYKDLSSRPKRSSHSSSFKGWWNDPEVKRKRRVAKYKIYSAEGKLKTSLRKSYRWIKVQCSKLYHGT